jgi:phosphatidylinositol alpha 1,6-mannosyltransferase
MRVAVVAETFLPQMNGLTHSLLRILDHLARRGDDVLVLSPGAEHEPTTVSGFPVVPFPSSRRAQADHLTSWTPVGTGGRTL